MNVHDTSTQDTVPGHRYPAERHEPWCDLRQHALAVADALGPSGCVGRYIEHGVVGGWVTQDAPERGSGSRFVIDWRPAEGWNSIRPEEAADLSGLLARLLAEHRRPVPADRPRRPASPRRWPFTRGGRPPS